MPGRFNEILVGRYNRFLQKFLSMKGGPPAPQLATELMAVWSLFHGAENRYLEGWERFASSFGPTGGAAQAAAIRLRNPSGSNTMMVIEQIIIWSPQALNVSVQRSTTIADLTTVVSLSTNRIPDNRQRLSPTAIASTDTNASSTGITMFSIAQVLNQSVFVINDENQELPILPGEAIQLLDNTLAAQINGSFLWRERALEESERT